MKALFVNNAWSDNKKYSTLINVLLFLVSINFLHYGQLLLPVICLLIFIINNKKLYLGDIKEFVCLLLFGIFFFIFDTTEGIYRTIGLFLPMAYYIGSNINNKEHYKQVLILLAIGMVAHTMLNFIYDFYEYGILLFRKRYHYDFWTMNVASTTSIATNFIFYISLFFYLFESKLVNKTISVFLFVFIMLYNIGIGRRAPIIMLFISLFIFVIYVLFFKKTKNHNYVKTILLYFLVFFVITFLLYYLNVLNMKEIINHLTIIEKFKWGGLNLGRLYIYQNAAPYFLNYLWGGRQISLVIEDQFHDLWFDVYDSSGVLCFAVLIIFALLIVYKMIKILRIKNISFLDKFIIISFFVCCFLQMLIEPIMSSSSIFLICFIIVISSIETNLNKV